MKKIIFVLAVCFACWSTLVHAGGVSKASSAKPDARYPYVGYYETKATDVDRSATPPEIVEEPTELKWFRLYKDGTYRTNKIGSKEQKGRYVFDAKRKRISFKSGWLKSYVNSQAVSFVSGSDIHPLPYIVWNGPGECMTQCDWKRK